ncbi:MAG TPA: GAF domain-containing sensor histidine kinase [Solirubrobacterales bacterium]|nr:GAF domain-containing sensor histidine kinase [Solirubrobacterales bacterium]
MEFSDQSVSQEEDRFKRLIEVGASLLSELDLESVLRSVVEAAQELTGAKYAALGVLDQERKALERFIYLGIDDETRRNIGSLPRGHGVLGELIREPVPLRLADVNHHPHAYGFPPGHPPMHSFLGVPVMIRGQAFGNLYMTEKQGADEFDKADEEAAKTLAVWAAIAIENARLYTTLIDREAKMQQALRQAEASVDIARTVGGEVEVNRVLDLIVKRARALVEARTLIVLLSKRGHLVLAAQAGQDRPGLEGLEGDEPVIEATMQGREAKRLDRDSIGPEAALRDRLEAEAVLIVPLLFRGHTMGVLVALDREAGGADFDQEDLRLLQAFGASAATAVATAQSVESERLQQQVEIAEKERDRWARELHDETLQGLAATRIILATALQSDAAESGERLRQAAEQTVDQLEGQINELSRLIDDLRPASLERLGLPGALEALAEECAMRGGFTIDTEVELDGELSHDEERTVYRLAQEALNNVVRHAAADHASLRAKLVDGEASVVVGDDGRGFDPDGPEGGRGLIGMRERVTLLGGSLEVRSQPSKGTEVAASIPIRSDRRT